MTEPSSITSVTEEDSDESDTTETSSYSKVSDGVSSFLYSSECNTDDKLSPGLVRISISQDQKFAPKKRQIKHLDIDIDSHDTKTAPYPYPYGCNPVLFQKKEKPIQPRKKKQKRSLQLHAAIKASHLQPSFTRVPFLPQEEEENFGVEDPENCLFTDFSDTSSRYVYRAEEGLDSCNNNNCQSDEYDHRPYFPDMHSNLWFQAKCFDHYWSCYSFVMEWYNQHIQAVYRLSHQLPSHVPPQSDRVPKMASCQSAWKKRSRSKRSKNRARNRRLAKAKQKETKELKQLHADKSPDLEGTNQDIEMSEEMMDFFATSFKHRMERDHNKEDNFNVGSAIKDKQNGFVKGDSEMMLGGPEEQPGVRRTAEMKTLYGAGAPMIQGMETALQMSYDKILDRNQPKLWPNMPLKIVFA